MRFVIIFLQFRLRKNRAYGIVNLYMYNLEVNEMTKTLILFGGVSSEHDVSCVSAQSVVEHIPRDKYDVLLLGITKAGTWLFYEGDTADLPKDRWVESGKCTPAALSPDRENGGVLVFRETGVERIPVDVAFPVLHGKNGEDGTVQGLLELAGIPCVGCGVLASAMCMDKAVTNLLADTVGIPQTKWLTVTATEYQKDEAAFCARAVETLSLPLFVKPANAGSSRGISKVNREEDLPEAIKTAFAHDRKLVLEAAVENPLEVECAVLGNEAPMVSVVGGIVPCKEFYDYEAKYIDEGSVLQIPAQIPPAAQEEIRATALRVFALLGCRGMARVDFFYQKDTGRVLFNEINTIPGFTSISMYAKLMEQSGVPYPKLLDRLFKLALEQR